MCLRIHHPKNRDIDFWTVLLGGHEIPLDKKYQQNLVEYKFHIKDLT